MNKLYQFWALFLLFSNSAYAQKAPITSSSLTVFSESNMAYALTEIARSYAKNKNVVTAVSFNYSSELIQNIDSGEPADVFISSHPSWLESLKQKGLVDVYNLVNIAKDQLVLVTATNNPQITNNLIKDSDSAVVILKLLSAHKIPLIIASQSSSLGRYTNQLIQQADTKDSYLYRKINEDKKNIVDFLLKNNQYCGIIMASEMKRQPNIKILKIIPDINIYYQGLVIAGDNMEKGRDFLQYLKSAEAKKILSENGFIVD